MLLLVPLSIFVMFSSLTNQCACVIARLHVWLRSGTEWGFLKKCEMEPLQFSTREPFHREALNIWGEEGQQPFAISDTLPRAIESCLSLIFLQHPTQASTSWHLKFSSIATGHQNPWHRHRPMDVRRTFVSFGCVCLARVYTCACVCIRVHTCVYA